MLTWKFFNLLCLALLCSNALALVSPLHYERRSFSISPYSRRKDTRKFNSMLSMSFVPSSSKAAILTALISASFNFSPFGNIGEAIRIISQNTEAATCTLDTQIVDENHGSCQLLNDVVRFRAGKLLTIRQDWGGSASTGAAVWNGANMGSWYLENVIGRDKLKGASVIELGAGVGFTSLVAQYLGATDVVITDGNEDVLKLADENIVINIPEDEKQTIRTARLQWDTEDEDSFLTSPKSNKPWDYIIAADVTYLKKNRPLLLHTIAKLSGPTTTTLLSMEPRSVGEVEDVLAEAEKAGLRWKEEKLPVDPVKSQCNLLCARMFTLTKK